LASHLCVVTVSGQDTTKQNTEESFQSKPQFFTVCGLSLTISLHQLAKTGYAAKITACTRCRLPDDQSSSP